MCDRSHLKNRPAKKRDADVTTIEWGFVADNNFGPRLECYVCGAPHKARGLARIRRDQSTTNVPLCEPCVASHPADAIMRKFSNGPDLEISDGGELTEEEVMAFADKRDTTEH